MSENNSLRVDDLLTAAQVAQHFQVTLQTARKWIRTNQLRSITLDGRTRLVPRAALADFYRSPRGRRRKPS